MFTFLEDKIERNTTDSTNRIRIPTAYFASLGVFQCSLKRLNVFVESTQITTETRILSPTKLGFLNSEVCRANCLATALGDPYSSCYRKILQDHYLRICSSSSSSAFCRHACYRHQDTYDSWDHTQASGLRVRHRRSRSQLDRQASSLHPVDLL